MVAAWLVAGAALGAAGCGGKVSGGSTGTGSSSGGAIGAGSGSGSGSGSSGGGARGGSGSGSSSGGSAGSSGVSGGSSSGGPPAGCETSNLPGCEGSQGYLCVGGVTPASMDAALSCSAPGPTIDGATSYCCVSFSSGGNCFPDAAVAAQYCPDPGTYGFQCPPGENPVEFDASLTCSAGIADPTGNTDFCCVAGSGGSSSGSSSGGVPPGCTADSAVACSGSAATGFSCTSGTNPAGPQSSYACTTPVADASGNDDYCCIEWPYGTSTCAPDDALTTACPDPGTYGFQCTSGNDPTTLSSQLTCSQAVADPDGIHDDYCCDD